MKLFSCFGQKSPLWTRLLRDYHHCSCKSEINFAKTKFKPIKMYMANDILGLHYYFPEPTLGHNLLYILINTDTNMSLSLHRKFCALMTSEVENYFHLSRVWKIFSALSVASSSENPCRPMKTLIFSQPNNCFHVGDGLTWTAYMRQNISTISSRSISPEESLSYIRNAHLAQLNLFTHSFQHLYENDQGTHHVQK